MLALAAGMIVPRAAAAGPARGEPVPEPPRRDLVRVDPPGVVPPGPDALPLPSRTLYLNDCKPDGCWITRADHDDARADRSSIARRDGRLSPYPGSAESWDAIVACVRANYAPFEIEVTTVDPGDAPHFEAYAAGLPSELGFPGPVAGISSFACGVVPNALSFSFLGLGADDVDEACWTISQESAHNFGLAHTMLAADAMSYFPLPAKKRFVDATACIGTQGCCQPERECQCGMREQNSHRRLLEIFGPRGATGPDVLVTEPADGARVRPGFAVRATASDLDGVARVELLVDGQLVATSEAPAPAGHELRAPTALVAGAHAVTVRALDRGGAAREATIVVAVEEACASDEACAAAGPEHACVDGRCQPVGPGPTGGCSSGGPDSPPLALALPALALLAVSGRRGSGRRRRGS